MIKHAGGRPRGVTMPCGWGCGAKLTAREMRQHFTDCPSRPERLLALSKVKLKNIAKGEPRYEYVEFSDAS